MEDGTLRRLELYLHDLHKKIDGIYDMLMLRHERSGEERTRDALASTRIYSTTRISVFCFKFLPVPCNATAVWECFPTSGWDRRPATRRKT